MAKLTLTPEQLNALTAFAKANGRTWKSKLRHAWESGRYNDYITADAGSLQQIRNSFGPSWLIRFSLTNTEVVNCAEEVLDAETEADEDAEPDTPEDGDITTTDHRKFWQYGKLVLHLDEDEDVNAAVQAFMDKSQFWPNCWFISDHGNAHLMDLSPEVK